jgi:hypothetical protein
MLTSCLDSKPLCLWPIGANSYQEGEELLRNAYSSRSVATMLGAIAAFKRALEYIRCEEWPEGWRACHLRLAECYANGTVGDPLFCHMQMSYHLHMIAYMFGG